MTIELMRADERDIPFIMECERRPDYERLVGRWDAAQHRATMADPDWLYLLGGEGGVPGGFAMLSGLTQGHGDLYLKRIASHDAGQGFGKPFLAAVTDWAFAKAGAHRFWLKVVADNARARHVYHALGFADEGVVRDVIDGAVTGAEFIQMAILKPDWKR
jgi:RimJ/RimL family protein N-acetyltransferase